MCLYVPGIKKRTLFLVEGRLEHGEEGLMGELVAWGLGLGLGYSARNMLTGWRRILLFVIAIILLGCLITLLSGELATEPWLVLVDIGQVAVAALLGVFVLPYGLRWLQRVARPEAR
jgi:hypothetical protein